MAVFVMFYIHMAVLSWFKPCLNHVVSHLHLAPSKAFWATRTAEESSPKSICPRKARRPPYQRVTISRACSSKFLGFILAVWVVEGVFGIVFVFV
jgi:hypothetical protein